MTDPTLPTTTLPDGQTAADCLAGGGRMGALMRAMDWAATPLGPVAQWPQSLRSAVSICLGSRFPMLIWWGPDLVMLYNDAYRPMLGATKHPQALGQAGRACWPEIWPIIGPMLEDTVMTQGQATWSDDQLLLLDRNNYLEECYFTFSYSPIRDESGVGGVFCAVTETTARVIGERRLRTLRELAARAGDAKTAAAAGEIAIQTLANNPGRSAVCPALSARRRRATGHLGQRNRVAPRDASQPNADRFADSGTARSGLAAGHSDS
jgi:hypothetical protein